MFLTKEGCKHSIREFALKRSKDHRNERFFSVVTKSFFLLCSRGMLLKRGVRLAFISQCLEINLYKLSHVVAPHFIGLVLAPGLLCLPSYLDRKQVKNRICFQTGLRKFQKPRMRSSSRSSQREPCRRNLNPHRFQQIVYWLLSLSLEPV